MKRKSSEDLHAKVYEFIKSISVSLRKVVEASSKLPVDRGHASPIRCCIPSPALKLNSMYWMDE